MRFSFDPTHGLIIVRAELEGPTGSAVLRLAFDTGATTTLINTGMLVSIGYDPSLVPDRIQVTTGSAVEYLPCLTISKVTALGQERTSFPVLCHMLPPSAGIDGLLGLDFIRGKSVTIDFRAGQIDLV